MFKPGAIIKIQVKNFVTYSYTELYPGPNLNMIIGPNGTGKSTMVAAIILGLGGNPKVVGRGTKIADYVKHNCQEATITIYLQGEEPDKYMKITRIINTDSRSKWYLGNENVPEKNILSAVKEFNIQVDNLCQFLPQDRVQDFAKLNQQELLRDTQKALCREDLIERQQKLTEYQANLKSTEQKIVTSTNILRQAQESNARIEGKVKNFKKKKQYLARIRDVERKIAWVQYDQAHEKFAQTKEDLNKATEIYNKHKNEAKPMQNEIENAKSNVTNVQQRKSATTGKMRDLGKTIKSNLQNFNRHKQSISRAKEDMNDMLQQLERKNNEIETTAKKIEEMKTTQTTLMSKFGDGQAMDSRFGKINSEIQKLVAHTNVLGNKKEQLLQMNINEKSQLRAYQHEISRLENIKSQRLNLLRNLSEDTYQAVLWLRANKNQFQSEILEPIVLEVNVLEQKDSIYLENVISARDRIAFTCTNKNDMNTLIRCLREDKKWTVNVLYSNPNDDISRYRAPVPIEQLKKYGLYTYLSSLFTAPGPIMSYLCKNYRVHNIPVGNSNTNKYYQDIPREIRLFFSDNQRFSVSFSKYSGEKSISQSRISSNGTFGLSLDVIGVENLRQKIADTERNIERYSNQAGELEQQMNQIVSNVRKLKEETKQVDEMKQEIKRIDNRINAMKNSIKEMQRGTNNRETIIENSTRKIRNILKEMGKTHDELRTNHERLNVLAMKYTQINLLLENNRNKVVVLENKFADLKRLCEEAQATFENVRRAYGEQKTEAKNALSKAKSMSNGFTPDDEGFEEFKAALDELSSDLEELTNEKEVISSKIDCLTTADADEIRDYENCLKQIEEQQQTIETSQALLTKLTSKIEKVAEKWLTPLRELIGQINERFSAAFERMGCAGEVSLNVGNDEKQYSNYGICIKVTYRNGEPLQELNNVVQSGGERAVATATFMLSLQELTPVPFRCVDEINQGMDANNERRIFELIVDSTSQTSTAQYFLITPKLVPNLKFVRQMMIHVVHNGFFVEQDKKWFASTLCNPMQVEL